MEFIILLLLILLNGVFALAEMALVSAQTAKLRHQADEGNASAAAALRLRTNPGLFLSTVQIGITLVGIGAGAFGGSAIADQLASLIRLRIPALTAFATEIGFICVVLVTTYLALVFGELVPKRIALRNPERMAVLAARPIALLATAASPIVWILTQSTELILGLLALRNSQNTSITDFDVVALVREGTQSGTFNTIEHEMVKGALELDDTRLRTIITPRTEIVYLDISAPGEVIKEAVIQHRRSAYPVCLGDMDHVVGVVRAHDLLAQVLTNGSIDLHEVMSEPIFVPETVAASEVLHLFRQSRAEMVLVVSEHGGVEGIVTLNDIIEEIVGDLDMGDPNAVRRPDGTWLIDGHTPIDQIIALFPGLIIPEEERSDYETCAGFVLTRFGHIPQASDQLHWHDHIIEVIDMDGKRIDKLLISPPQ